LTLLEQWNERGTPEEKAQEAADRRRYTERGKYHLEQLDALTRMRWAIEEQTKRVATGIETERENPLFCDAVTKDMRLLSEMCEKIINLEMSLGVRDRKPNEIILQHKRTFDRLISGLEEDDGELLIAGAGKFLELMNDKILTLEIGDDGSYSMHPTTEAERVADFALGICGGIGVLDSQSVRDEDPADADLGELDFRLSHTGN